MKFLTILFTLSLTFFIQACSEEQASSTTTATNEPSTATPVAPKFQEGQHYLKLKKPLDVGQQTTVMEFFWYACPHCYHFETTLQPWINNHPEVKFEKIPAVFGESWRLLAKAHYVAKALNIEPKMTPILFDEIHQKAQKIETEEQLEAIFVAQGISSEEFNKTLAGFSKDDDISDPVDRAVTLGNQFELTSVPTIVVNGQYVVNNNAMSSYEDILAVTDYLIKKKP